MFGFRKKKYVTAVDTTTTYLKNLSQRLNGLQRYTAENEKINAALAKLKEDCIFTIAPPENKEVRAHQEEIERLMKKLSDLLHEEEWDERTILLYINDIGAQIDGISASRS
jgi:predicted RNase H-like nuclease (RuvC/YqgF family)